MLIVNIDTFYFGTFNKILLLIGRSKHCNNKSKELTVLERICTIYLQYSPAFVLNYILNAILNVCNRSLVSQIDNRVFDVSKH